MNIWKEYWLIHGTYNKSMKKKHLPFCNWCSSWHFLQEWEKSPNPDPDHLSNRSTREEPYLCQRKRLVYSFQQDIHLSVLGTKVHKLRGGSWLKWLFMYQHMEEKQELTMYITIANSIIIHLHYSPPSRGESMLIEFRPDYY